MFATQSGNYHNHTTKLRIFLDKVGCEKTRIRLHSPDLWVLCLQVCGQA